VGWANGSGLFMAEHDEKNKNVPENNGTSDNYFLYST